MPPLTFKNKKDIKNSAVNIARLVAGWGLQPTEWMIGKQMSFFFSGIITDPKKIISYTNVYILYRRLPWRCSPKARLVFPPKSSKYAQQYYQLQKRQSIGIDLMPIPDKNLNTSFITANRLMIPVKNYQINFESIEKFIYRLTVLNNFFLKKSSEEIREFYFADKKRYQGRLKFYKRISKGIKSSATRKKMNEVTEEYKILMKRAYPELFTPLKQNRTNIFEGKTAFDKKEIMAGKAIWYNPKGKYRLSKEKLIFIFSHFYPADTRILPYAKAIVTEGGGLLSHAAVVCRELKIPCLVGVRGLKGGIKNSQQV